MVGCSVFVFLSFSFSFSLCSALLCSVLRRKIIINKIKIDFQLFFFFDQRTKNIKKSFTNRGEWHKLINTIESINNKQLTGRPTASTKQSKSKTKATTKEAEDHGNVRHVRLCRGTGVFPHQWCGDRAISRISIARASATTKGVAIISTAAHAWRHPRSWH